MRLPNAFRLSEFRNRISRYDAIAAYALLGLVSGALSGILVLGFFEAIRALGAALGAGSEAENFESLSGTHRFLLAFGGALVVAGIVNLLPEPDRANGIKHVIHSLNRQYGQLSWRNGLAQAVTAVVGLATGQSGGREGPGVHIGASINSWLGQRLRLPNNSLRVLIACGTAGSIAAAFNTPLAGVIFAMEVILAEYTILGFIPVLVAAATAAAITQLAGNTEALFSAPYAHLQSLTELPWVILLGIVIGASAALLSRIAKGAAHLLDRSVWVRFGAAGLVTGTIGIAIPGVMGMGSDSIALILAGEASIGFLIILALAKIGATGFTAGVGMPVGTIGPSLLIGAAIGGIIGQIGATLNPSAGAEHSLYAVLGMASYMGVLLNAPLAAILAAIELTRNIDAAMPAFLCVVASAVTYSTVFRQRALHRSLAGAEEIAQESPIEQLLHRTHVASCWDRDFTWIKNDVQFATFRPKTNARWCVIAREDEPVFVALTEELRQALAHNQDATPLEVDIRRFAVTAIEDTASAKRAWDELVRNTAELALVYNAQGRVHAGVWLKDIEAVAHTHSE